MSNDAHKANNAAAEIRAKGRRKPLSIDQKIRFLELLRKGASAPQFQAIFGMRSGDVQKLRNEMGAITDGDIVREINRLRTAKEGTSTLVSGYSEMLDYTPEATPEAPSDIENTPAPKVDTFQKIEDRRWEKIAAEVAGLEDRYKDFQIPRKDQDRFKRGIKLGKRFWSRVYSVPAVVIVNEAKRLIPTIKFEDIPT